MDRRAVTAAVDRRFVPPPDRDRVDPDGRARRRRGGTLGFDTPNLLGSPRRRPSAGRLGP
ncbi:MAG: hypothetical protein ACYCPV_03315 [Thermoplasmata archaeon]